jgi:ferredoxin
VTYTVEWPGLSAEEKAEAYVLPCVARPLSDVVLEQPAATAG